MMFRALLTFIFALIPAIALRLGRWPSSIVSSRVVKQTSRSIKPLSLSGSGVGGVFRLPDDDEQESLYEEREEAEVARANQTPQERTLIQLLLSFDNLQRWEIEDMNHRIWLGTSEDHIKTQGALMRLTAQAEALIDLGRRRGSLASDEVQEELRVFRSRVRMVGKDAERYGQAGEVLPLPTFGSAIDGILGTFFRKNK